MNIAPPSKTYNGDDDAPITPLELNRIARDLRYPKRGVLVVTRNEVKPGAFTIEWMGMYGMIHIVFCRDAAELESMKERLAEAGFTDESYMHA